MSALDLPVLPLASLAVSASHDRDEVTVHFSGVADMRATESLDTLLSKVHAEALKLAAQRVSIDFRDLEFMNSSCFKSFVTWISDVRDLEPERRYSIRFLSKPEMLWQRRSLHALRCFAVDIITIET